MKTLNCRVLAKKIEKPAIYVLVLAWVAILACGAIEGQDIQTEPPQDPSGLRAKAELENPEPERGPVPEDSDPDVAKRPRLHTALAKQRLRLSMNTVFTFTTFVDAEQIRASAKEALRERWQKVVAPEFLPAQDGIIEWRGSNDYPTAPEQRRVGARWGTSVGLMIADGSEFHNNRIKLCLQLSGEDRISFRFRAPHEGGEARRREDIVPQDILDKPRLLEILTTYFRFPFETLKDFQVISGPSGEYAGVRIFSGSFRWSKRLTRGEGTGSLVDRDPDGYDEADLFITDSEPQYFCIGVTFGESK